MPDETLELVKALQAQGLTTEEIKEFFDLREGKKEGEPLSYENMESGMFPVGEKLVQAHTASEHMMSLDPSLLAQQPPPQDTPAIRGVIDQKEVGNLVTQLKQMEGIHDVQIVTNPDGTAQVDVKASFPQPVADMIVSLTPSQPAPGPIKAEWVKTRETDPDFSFRPGPFSNIIHDEMEIEVGLTPGERVVFGLMAKPGLAWEVLQGLKGQKLLGPWNTTDGGYEDAEEIFIERMDTQGVCVALVGPTADDRYYATLHEEEEDAVTRGERFDTFEEAMTWADEELEREGYVLA